jgi:hypothetical protein
MTPRFISACRLHLRARLFYFTVKTHRHSLIKGKALASQQMHIGRRRNAMLHIMRPWLLAGELASGLEETPEKRKPFAAEGLRETRKRETA